LFLVFRKLTVPIKFKLVFPCLFSFLVGAPQLAGVGKT
jgi:hypothetical protein